MGRLQVGLLPDGDGRPSADGYAMVDLRQQQHQAADGVLADADAEEEEKEEGDGTVGEGLDWGSTGSDEKKSLFGGGAGGGRKRRRAATVAAARQYDFPRPEALASRTIYILAADKVHIRGHSAAPFFFALLNSPCQSEDVSSSLTVCPVAAVAKMMCTLVGVACGQLLLLTMQEHGVESTVRCCPWTVHWQQHSTATFHCACFRQGAQMRWTPSGRHRGPRHDPDRSDAGSATDRHWRAAGPWLSPPLPRRVGQLANRGRRGPSHRYICPLALKNCCSLT